MLYQINKRLLYFIIPFAFLQAAFANSFKCVKDGFFADEKDCWIYHICVGTTHSVKACKEDLLFNPMKNECDWAMNVNCSHSSYTDALPVTTPKHQLYPEDYVSHTNENLSTESILERLCQTIENDYTAHPSDCKRYAYCANGVPQPKQCKKGLLWSQAERMCVWPAQSDCPAKNLTPEPYIPVVSSPYHSQWTNRATSYPISYTIADPVLTPRAPTNPFHSSVECPPTKFWRIPDPFDCSIYHDCQEGTDLVSYCPALLKYNPERQSCDHAQNVPCTNKCTDKNEGSRFVDPISCCHFYECTSGKLIHQTCLHPNLFDIRTRKCLPYKKVKCDGRRQCLSKCHYLSNYDVGKGLCEFLPSCAGHGDGFYLDKTKPNCQSYIQCLDNRVVNQSRCLHGQRFNRNLGRCTSADQVPCFATASIRRSIFIILISLIGSSQIL